jgi:hypothetical protein
VFTSLTQQLRVNSSVDTFKGKSQRIHASRFTLQASRIAACRPPGHSQLRRLAGRSQPGPVLADFHPRKASQGMACLSATLLSAQHQACSWQPALIYRPIFFSRARHLQTRSIPNFQKISMLSAATILQAAFNNSPHWLATSNRTRCTEAITSGPRTAVSSFNKNVDISAQVLNARSPFLQKIHDNLFLTTPEQARPGCPRPAVQAHDPGNLNTY